MLSQKQLTNIETIRNRIAKEHKRPAGYRPNLTCLARGDKVISTIVANTSAPEELDLCDDIHGLIVDMLSLSESPWTAKTLLSIFKSKEMANCQMVIIHYVVANKKKIFVRSKATMLDFEQVCLPETLAMLRIIQ